MKGRTQVKLLKSDVRGKKRGGSGENLASATKLG